MRVRPTLGAKVAAVLLPAVLLATVACGSAEPSPKSPHPSSVPESLQFTGATLDGKPFDAASLAGRPAVLWFWAPWCATCFGQASWVAEDAQQYAGRVSFLGVAGLGGAAEMAEFVTDGEVGGVPHLNDQAGAVWRKFGITQQSHFVMLDKAGKVVHKGYLDGETLGKWVAHLAT